MTQTFTDRQVTRLGYTNYAPETCGLMFYGNAA
jgi:hypothetical protein